MSLWLWNLGSFFLGMTIAVAILLQLAGRSSHRENDVEGCLTVFICTCGLSIAVLFYIVAWSFPS